MHGGSWEHGGKTNVVTPQIDRAVRALVRHLSDNWFYLSLFLSLALSHSLSPWPWQAKGKMLQVMDELKRALADSTGPILCPIQCP